MLFSVHNCKGKTIKLWWLCPTNLVLKYGFRKSFFFQYPGMDLLYDLQMPVVSTTILLILLFMYFYMGQIFHSQTKALSDGIYQVGWYRYPRTVRLYLLLMIQRSQRSFYLSAYGIMTLNLENFVVVSRQTNKWCIITFSSNRYENFNFSYSSGSILLSCYWYASSNRMACLVEEIIGVIRVSNKIQVGVWSREVD